MHQPRAIIFDLDGTLIDSLDDIAAALNTALHERGRPSAQRDSVRRWIGDGLPALCRRAWPNATTEEMFEFTRAVGAAYAAACTHFTRPYPNILPMLDLLRAQNVPMAVLTNKPHDLSVAILDSLDLARFFEPVHGYHTEAEKKPSPTVALRIASRWNIDPREIAIVGDSDGDIRTARSAGMTAIAVSWGLRDREELFSAGPDLMVDDPLDLAKKFFS